MAAGLGLVPPVVAALRQDATNAACVDCGTEPAGWVVLPAAVRAAHAFANPPERCGML